MTTASSFVTEVGGQVRAAGRDFGRGVMSKQTAAIRSGYDLPKTDLAFGFTGAVGAQG